MRNVLVHDYDAVNLERLWDTAIQDMRQGGNVADRSAFTVRRSPFGVR